MEKELYLSIFAAAFIIFLISIFYDKDWQIQGIFATISFVLFTGLLIQSLNIEILAYEGAWQSYQTTDYYLYFGLAFILSIFSFFHGFILFTTKPQEKLSGSWYQAGRPGSKF